MSGFLKTIEKLSANALSRVERVDQQIDPDCLEAFKLNIPFYVESLSKNSAKAFETDIRLYFDWCLQYSVRAIPSDPFTVRAYLEELAKNKSLSTLRRRLSSINSAHRIIDLKQPGSSSIVMNIIASLSEKSFDEGQARPLRVETILKIEKEINKKDSREVRDMALIATAHSTLLRGFELCNIRVSDLELDKDGAVRVTKVKGRKGSGSVQYAYLSPIAVTWIKAWLKVSKLSGNMLLFASMTKHRTLRDSALQTQDVSDVMRRLGDKIGEGKFTAHSCRVGGAQDMMSAGVEMSKAMQAGRWKNTTTFLKYVRKISAKESGMASFYRDLEG